MATIYKKIDGEQQVKIIREIFDVLNRPGTEDDPELTYFEAIGIVSYVKHMLELDADSEYKPYGSRVNQ